MPVISSVYSSTGSSYISPSLSSASDRYTINSELYSRNKYRYALSPSSSSSYRRTTQTNDTSSTSSKSSATTRGETATEAATAATTTTTTTPPTAVTNSNKTSVSGTNRYTSSLNNNNNNNLTSDYTLRYPSRSECRARDSDNNYSYKPSPRSTLLTARATIPIISGADFFEKYRVSNYTPRIEVTPRSRSLSETPKVTRDSLSPAATATSSTTSKIRTSSSIRNALPPTSSVANRSWDRGDSYRSTLSTPRKLSETNDDKSDSSSISSSGDTSEKKTKAEGLCGLWNIGNTCFMNSVIQCLSHTNELTKYLKSQSTTPRGTSKDHRILSEYTKLIKDMWTANIRSVNPTELKYAFSSKHRMYSGSAQQDAQEFLRFFLDSLHSALNTAIKPDPVQIDDDLSDSEISDLMWDWYSKAENSLVKDLFVGQLRSTLKCTVCGNSSVTFDPFWDLSLPLPSSPSKLKLENCLELFIKEEVLDGDEMPTCCKCKTRRKSTKSLTIHRFPKYLVIHLKRFSETRWSKLTNVIEFPTGERELNLTPFASECSPTSANYSLYGVSNHMGSTAGGHYIAACKHPLTRRWHDFNDNFVSDASESSLVSSSAYLLFYERA